MNEVKNAMAILADKAICGFCGDCGNDEVCIKCKTVSPVTAEELKKFYKVVIQSLKEKLERVNPKPLTLEELKNMGGEPVWVETMKEWRTVCFGLENDIRLYSVFNTISAKHVFNNDGRIYRHKPEHIGEATNMAEGE